MAQLVLRWSQFRGADSKSFLASHSMYGGSIAGLNPFLKAVSSLERSRLHRSHLLTYPSDHMSQ